MTSWGELRKDGLAADEHNFLGPDQPPKTAYVTEQLSSAEGPFVGVSDFMHALPDMIRQWVPGDYATLGAEGFGFSDTRPAARRYFKIDGPSIAARVLQQLEIQGKVQKGVSLELMREFNLDDVRAGTSGSAGGDA